MTGATYPSHGKTVFPTCNATNSCSALQESILCSPREWETKTQPFCEREQADETIAPSLKNTLGSAYNVEMV